MLIFIIGPSASGKGTQADLLAEKYAIPHLSMGQLLRDEIVAQTEIGKIVEPILNAGKFVAPELTLQVLTTHLEEAFEKYGGAILDGYPRLIDQATAIQPFIDKYNKDWFRVVHYVLSYEECFNRQQARSQNGGARDDDHVLKERYDSYKQDIDKIEKYYVKQGKLIEIDARPSVEEIFNNTVFRLEESLQDSEKILIANHDNLNTNSANNG